MHYRFLFASLALFTLSAIFAQNQPAFEVASIKPADLNERLRTHNMHLGAKIDGSRADFGAQSLRELIQFAFRIKSFQISGLGDTDAHFDILAKLPVGETPDEVPEMLQQLLVERFRLAFHWDNSKEFSVYALVVDPRGAKLKLPPPDFDQAANLALPQNLHRVPMKLDRFAGELAWFLGKPVVNKTAMQGEFMVPLGRMSAIFQQRMEALVASQSGRDPTASVPDNSGIAAMLADLGLKLETRKLPFPVLVIDKLEKNPTEQ